MSNLAAHKCFKAMKTAMKSDYSYFFIIASSNLFFTEIFVEVVVLGLELVK